jgi:3-dehydroquinate dehydratase-2
MKYRILVLNGPGLADLSGYSPDVHPGLTLEGIRGACAKLCESLGMELDFRQTEDRNEMLRWLGDDGKHFDGLVFSPFNHSQPNNVKQAVYHSAAKVVKDVGKPIVEVHISNILSESVEITEPIHEPAGDVGLVCGLGLPGYLLAIRAIAARLMPEEAA